MKTNRSMNPLRGLAIACAAGAAVSVATDARANIYGEYNSPTNYTWWVTGLVDFDQVRRVRPANLPFAGLPAGGGLANDGRMYCVPTATMNLFAYAAHHGYPNLSPFSSSYSAWQTMEYADANYEAATFALAVLGGAMSTSPTGGTNNTGWWDGASSWVAPVNVDIGMFVTSNNWAPLSKHMGQICHNTGGIVALCYGRYTWEPGGGPQGQPELISRESGHCVSLQRIEVSSSNSATIWIRNPSTGGSESDWLQSQFVSTEFDTDDVTYFIEGKGLRPMSKLDVGGDQLRLLNSVYLVQPQQGFVQKSIAFEVANLGGLVGNTPPWQQNASFDPPDGLSWDQVEICPMRSHYVGVSKGINPDTGREEKFLSSMHPGVRDPNAPSQTPIQPNTSQILYGTDMNLYVMAPTGVEIMRPNDDFEYDSADSFQPPSGFVPRAMWYDEDDFQLCLLDSSTGVVLVYPPYSGWNGNHEPLVGRIDPPTIPPEPIAQWAPPNPFGHELILGGRDSDVIRLYSRCSPATYCQVSTFRLPGGATPNAISPTNDGAIYITTTTGEVWCMENDSGVWTRNRMAAFDGVQAERFIASRSRTNNDPSVEPPYTNILPEDLVEYKESVDCGFADVTTTTTNPGDDGYGRPEGVIDGADLAYYVELWLARSVFADLNTTTVNPGDALYGIADGTVDGADLSYYVEGWLAGCP